MARIVDNFSPSFLKKQAVILALFLLCWAASLPVFAAGAVSAKGGAVTDAASFVAALGGDDAAYSEGSTIVLRSDIDLTAPVTIKSGEYSLQGAGCYINRAPASKNALFVIESGASLTLGNEKGSDSHPSLTINGGGIEADAALIYVKGGILNINVGTLIDSGSNTGNGGGICAENAEVNIYGGVISGCKAKSGGGIYIKGGKLITCGSLLSNTASDGGGIYSEGADTVLSNIVSKNTAENGGGIYNSGNMSITACEISYNTASVSGGGIFNSGYLLTASSDVGLVHNDAPEGGAAYFDKNSENDLAGASVTLNTAQRGAGFSNYGSVNITAAEFTYNTASVEGCAINYGSVNMTGGSISSNDSDGYCGGIVNYGEFIMSDGSVSSNKSKNDKLGIDNWGKLELKGHAFISFNNPVQTGSYVSEDGSRTGGSVVTITGQLTANTPIATFYPVYTSAGSLDRSTFVPDYTKGLQIVSGDGDIVKTEYGKVAVSSYNGRTYAVNGEGKLIKTGYAEGAGIPVMLIVVVSAAALVVILIFVYIIIRAGKGRKKKGTEKTMVQNGKNNM